METLWSPWRSKYIDSFKKDTQDNSCFVCNAISTPQNDLENFIIKRFDNCITLLNKFPYNSGHLLICPIRHISEIEDLSDVEFKEINEVLRLSVKAIKLAFKPHGYNLGLNIGTASGAGLPGHLHYHIVPRWSGDTNFISTIGDINLISYAMEDTAKALRLAFEQIR